MSPQLGEPVKLTASLKPENFVLLPVAPFLSAPLGPRSSSPDGWIIQDPECCPTLSEIRKESPHKYSRPLEKGITSHVLHPDWKGGFNPGSAPWRRRCGAVRCYPSFLPTNFGSFGTSALWLSVQAGPLSTFPPAPGGRNCPHQELQPVIRG